MFYCMRPHMEKFLVFKLRRKKSLLNVCCVMVFYVFLCRSVCWFLYGPFCHGALKLDISTLFTTFFLYKIQKRAARLILMKPNRTPSISLFNTLVWLTFDNILKYHTAVLVYKAFNNQAPKYISDLFVNVSSHTYSLRSSTHYS